MNIINGCVTDRGIKKPINQDRIINLLFEQNGHSLFLGGIFDGISSLKDSELVAEQVSNAFFQWFEQIKEWVNLDTVSLETLSCHLLDILDEVALNIYEDRNGGKYNGGTTASIILILDHDYVIHHIGDSKVFMQKQEELIQLTEDEKIWGERNGVARYFLANYIGKASECEHKTYSGHIVPGDSLYYGSDGFFGKTSYEELRLLDSNIFKNSDIERVLQGHIELLKTRGETDNISVGLFKML